MATTLGNKAVGSVVKIPVDGVNTDFIIVHQGNPSTSLYDSSCNGTWVVAKDNYTKAVFQGDYYNSYGKSNVHSYLNDTFLNLLGIKSNVKTVKIPYTNGAGSSGTLSSGSSGLSTRVFLLSRAELGAPEEESTNTEGVALEYFSGVSSGTLNTRRKASDIYWTRTPYGDASTVWQVQANGEILGRGSATGTRGVRPAMVLNTTLLVNDDDVVYVNSKPVISGSNGSLGTFSTNAPTATYKVTDTNNDTVTVTVKLNGTTKKTHTVTLGTNYSYTITTSDFDGLALGTHTLTITANDGTASATRTYTFVKENPIMGYATVDGVNKPYSEVYVNVGGVWKLTEKMYVNIGGIWKSV